MYAPGQLSCRGCEIPDSWNGLKLSASAGNAENAKVNPESESMANNNYRGRRYKSHAFSITFYIRHLSVSLWCSRIAPFCFLYDGNPLCIQSLFARLSFYLCAHTALTFPSICNRFACSRHSARWAILFALRMSCRSRKLKGVFGTTQKSFIIFVLHYQSLSLVSLLSLGPSAFHCAFDREILKDVKRIFIPICSTLIILY